MVSEERPYMIKLSPAALDLQAINGADGIAPRSAILLKGKPTGKSVAGSLLEAAFKTEGGELLLFTTDDTPFEEMLNIQLLDAQLDPLDAAVLGSAYSTGSFEFLQTEGPSSLRFRFIGDTDWTVDIWPSHRLRTPWCKDSMGVSRPFGLFKRFVVRGDPKHQP